jgi:hypothetical protein
MTGRERCPRHDNADRRGRGRDGVMKPQKLTACILLLTLATAGLAQQDQEGQVEPKFVWGLLISYAVSKLSSTTFDAFTKWLDVKMEGGISRATDSVTPSFFKNSGAKIGPRGAGEGLAPAPDAGATPNVVVGNPETPLKVDGGRANYQALHIALVVAEGDGKHYVFRPVNEGFKTGERFKLRVISTFDGDLTIENINPHGERSQIYPPLKQDAVMLVQGKEAFLPLGQDEYFEFARSTGREQLVINIADPRAVGAAASRNKVYRQDTQYGSNFVQETSADTYPAISQSVEIVHSAQ